ncbi:MAG TPA: ABC transporter ATP-binding protein [Chryseolinea sp.]|nr:ABC transporter ATP-binding protein [Chryseolinea sp.]
MKLVVENLNKTYPNGIRALKNLSLTVYQGMFGLLGPNGAGKSTLMRTIATLQEADSGTITFGAIDVINDKQALRKVLGYLPQEFGLYPKITAEKLLDHLAYLKGITNASQRKNVINSLLHKTNLWAARNKNLGGFSGGMKQRFGIAQALLANPQLIIVDEPTAGLDPSERNRFLNLLSEIGENTVVILSTHIVDDVRELCPFMAIINNGEMLYKGKPADAIAQLNGKVWTKRVVNAELETHRREFNVVSERLFAGVREIHVISESAPDGSFEGVPPGLEDVYFGYISGSLKPYQLDYFAGSRE